MGKIEQAIKRMRWKAFFYMNPNGKNMQQTYGLKTLNCPPKIKELVSLERDLWNLAVKRRHQSYKEVKKALRCCR